jgi:hypothetical protein
VLLDTPPVACDAPPAFEFPPFEFPPFEFPPSRPPAEPSGPPSTLPDEPPSLAPPFAETEPPLPVLPPTPEVVAPLPFAPPFADPPPASTPWEPEAPPVDDDAKRALVPLLPHAIVAVSAAHGTRTLSRQRNARLGIPVVTLRATEDENPATQRLADMALPTRPLEEGTRHPLMADRGPLL